MWYSLRYLLRDILVHRFADLFGNIGALLPGDVVALLVGLGDALLPRHGDLLRPAVLPDHVLALLLVDRAGHRLGRLVRHVSALLPRDAPALLLGDLLLHLHLDGDAVLAGHVRADLAGELPGHRRTAVLRDELALLPGDLLLHLPGDLLALGLSDLVADVLRYLLAHVLLDRLAEGRRRLAVGLVQGVIGVVDVLMLMSGLRCFADLLHDLLADGLVLRGAVLLEPVRALLLVDGVDQRVVRRLADLLVGGGALLLQLGVDDRLALLLVDGAALHLRHLHDGDVDGGVADLLEAGLALLLELGLHDVVNDVVGHGPALLLGNLNVNGAKGYDFPMVAVANERRIIPANGRKILLVLLSLKYNEIGLGPMGH